MIPQQSYLRLFFRFLRFGLLAWGGPVAQIAMIRQELVEEEQWIDRNHFNRVLGVYQVLPGPEAHELCCYFGMLAGGRWGSVLAGVGFMLPGSILMFSLSWFYVTHGIISPLFASAFFGVQAAVVALILRAVHRIGRHALVQRWHWLIALAVFLFSLAPIPMIHLPFFPPGTGSPTLVDLLCSGLRAGLLTFGGAYTVIPFLQYDAVEVGRWMTNGQFLDGLALSGILPAPLIIFSTFVGFLGGGSWGAVVMTIGIFLPAFSFTLIGHRFFERLIHNPRLHTFLDGITAGVVGLIAAASVSLIRTGIRGIPGLAIFCLALIVLYLWPSKMNVAAAVLGAALLGLMFF